MRAGAGTSLTRRSGGRGAVRFAAAVPPRAAPRGKGGVCGTALCSSGAPQAGRASCDVGCCERAGVEARLASSFSGGGDCGVLARARAA